MKNRGKNVGNKIPGCTFLFGNDVDFADQWKELVFALWPLEDKMLSSGR